MFNEKEVINKVERFRHSSEYYRLTRKDWAIYAFPPSKIRGLRARFQWTQSELADALRVSRDSVAAWESCRAVPNKKSLQALRTLDARAGAYGPVPAYDITPEQIKALRLACGESQAAFAAGQCISRQTLIKWESGKARPKQENAALLHTLAVVKGLIAD